jgi:hypothetical protein
MEIEQQSFKRVDLVTVTGRVDGSNWSYARLWPL